MMELLASPEAWFALLTLTALEIVLGIDNVIFISVIVSRIPAEQAKRARQIGLLLALVFRIILLSLLVWLIGLTEPVFAVRGTELSWRDIILIAGGLFLVWKATKEIHHKVDADHGPDVFDGGKAAAVTFGGVIVQILLLDLVFSIDSIITAVGMTEHIPVMVIAVVFAVLVMLLAADPLASFIERNPTIVMLALGFLLMIGGTLIGEGFGAHVPKGYIYAAMAFSAAIEGLNMLSRRARKS
jgi:predicted tellurium resistance membrane protein TerC